MVRRRISVDELDRFELDEANRLYWEGSRVLLDQKVTLGAFERVIATAAALATVVAAVFPIGVHLQWW